MYHDVKKLMYTVNIGEPDVRFGNMLLGQLAERTVSWRLLRKS
jgi:Mn-containing catalase